MPESANYNTHVSNPDTPASNAHTPLGSNRTHVVQCKHTLRVIAIYLHPVSPKANRTMNANTLSSNAPTPDSYASTPFSNANTPLGMP